MNSFKVFVLGCIWLGGSLIMEAAPTKIIKVLPHYLDLQGRHSVSPSLFDRDAYQAYLRKNPQQCSGIRFDTQWKANTATTNRLKLRVEIRSSKGYTLSPYTVEKAVKLPRWLSRWSALSIEGAEFQKLGTIIAWRVSLWDDDQCLAEQKSFLW